jgi:APA family basic amino acid/polyamine antiporter
MAGSPETRMAERRDKPELLRALGLREGIAIHINQIIGSGIFIVPAAIAGYLHAMGPIMLVWILAGLLTLFGAVTLAELGSILPQAGGPYVFLRASFGRLWAFMYAWNEFFINKAGSAAAVAVAFATFLGYFFPVLSPERSFFTREWYPLGHPVTFSLGWIQIAAMVAIAFVTAINVRGVRLSGWVTTFFTTAKVAAIVGLIAAVAVSGKGSAGNFAPWWPERWTGETSAAFGLAMISALWAYDGWHVVTLSAGEIKDPRRNVPLSLLIGSAVVIVIYLAANLAYAYVIPIAAMPGSPRIAADVARTVLGPVGASLVVVGILCSTFGAENGIVLTGPRAIFAAGADGTFAKAFGEVHARFHTPHVAILTLGVWGAVLTLSGTFEQIISYVIFTSWFFYALTALCVIVLRRKMPDAPRPYRAWGYPYATLAFVAIALWLIVNTVLRDSRNAVIGIALLLTSLPFFLYWEIKRLRRDDNAPG